MVRLIIACLLLAAGILPAQDTMEVDKVSGVPELFDVNAISKITFTATDMVIAGPGRSIPLNTISVIYFHGSVTSVEEGGNSPVAVEALTPNPFNPATTLRFGLARDSRVDIAVYNGAGRKIRRLFSGQKKAGIYEISWNGQDNAGWPVSTGTYLVRCTINGKTVVKQAALIR